MSSLRDEIHEWTENGLLAPAHAPRALELAGLTPNLSGWRHFLRALLLWTGVVLIAAGVISFFAYNWHALHRFARFALAEFLFAAALCAAWHFGIERPAGKAALTAAALLTGALLALLGQTYQTGAGASELFALWAALILPWIITARFAPLWLLWLGLLNAAAATYFQERAWGLFGLLSGMSGTLWTGFALNAVALLAWELGLRRGYSWLDRWGARIVALLAGLSATAIGILFAVDSSEIGAAAGVAYPLWLLAMLVHYRFYILDIFMLAGSALSALIITTAFLSRHFLRHFDAAALLLIGLVVIGLSAAAAWWIRRLILEQSA